MCYGPLMDQGTGMTIDELARRAGCTTRNVRNYQTSRLLPPPAIIGRVAHYGEDHLARLRLIATLQAQGFSLAGIGQLTRAWEEGQSLADVLGFERALTEPWSDEQAEYMSPEDLLAAFPEAANDPAISLRSLELGLIVLEGDRIRVPHPRLLAMGAELAAAGIPLTVVQDQLVALRADMDRVARRFVELFEEHVWRPFVAAGLPPQRLPEVTDSLRRLRPLATRAVEAVLVQAMDHHVALSTVSQFATGDRTSGRAPVEVST